MSVPEKKEHVYKGRERVPVCNFYEFDHKQFRLEYIEKPHPQIDLEIAE